MYISIKGKTIKELFMYCDEILLLLIDKICINFKLKSRKGKYDLKYFTNNLMEILLLNEFIFAPLKRKLFYFI